VRSGPIWAHPKACDVGKTQSTPGRDDPLCQGGGDPGDGVVVDRNGRTERLKGFDSIVLAMGTVSDSGLYKRLKGVIPEVHLVGDARKPAKILEALTDAMELAQQI